jgi:hypothetical protein
VARTMSRKRTDDDDEEHLWKLSLISGRVTTLVESQHWSLLKTTISQQITSNLS